MLSTLDNQRAMPTAATSITSPSPFFEKLRITIQNLPETVAVGLPSDELAVFFTPAKDFVEDGQDAWEDVVNPTLDRVFGFGATADSIRALIRRGPYGMDGVCFYQHWRLDV